MSRKQHIYFNDRISFQRMNLNFSFIFISDVDVEPNIQLVSVL